MEHGNQTDIIIPDFAKTIDKVNHSLQLHKLHHYRVRGRVNEWIQNFLEDRQQVVVVMVRDWTSLMFIQGFHRGQSLAQACS